MDAQQCEYTSYHWTIHLKIVEMVDVAMYMWPQ